MFFFFFRELLNGCTGKETNEWQIKNANGRFLSDNAYELPFSAYISVVKIKKYVAVNKKSSFIFCTQFGGQNAGNGISELQDFKIFWGACPQNPLG